MADKNYETADFAGGCFWGIEEFFSKLAGVVKTEVGYEGGQAKNPTYEMVCSHTTGHAETTRVTFDPSKISYQRLLSMFLTMFPDSQLKRPADFNDSYRLAVFYHDQAQKQAADQILSEIKEKIGSELTVQVAPAKDFYPAEEYHQRFYEKLRADQL